MSSWKEKYEDLREVVDEITLIIDIGYSDDETLACVTSELEKEAKNEKSQL
tara:strand:- start:402 stop:554 length:153 start_codon:yes stop_codon:yes gene_type:complete